MTHRLTNLPAFALPPGYVIHPRRTKPGRDETNPSSKRTDGNGIWGVAVDVGECCGFAKTTVVRMDLRKLESTGMD